MTIEWWDLPYYDQHIMDYCTANVHILWCWEYLYGEV